MRLVIASMTIEELNSDRDKFLAQARDNINTELNKLGLYLMNINISDIQEANMAKNLAPSLEIARNLPITDSLKQIITGKKPEESPAKGDNFPPVK